MVNIQKYLLKKQKNVKVITDFYEAMSIRLKYFMWNKWLHKCSPHSSQYLVDAPLAWITTHWVCVDRSPSVLHIWTLQFYSTNPCKTPHALSGCMGIGHEPPFSSPATNVLLDWGRALTWSLQNIHLVVFKQSFTMGMMCLWWCAVLGVS